jgi:serine protease Do
MTQLLEKGKVAYGFLGVSPTSITPRQASALKVDSGALLFKDPASNSPAARAGLKAGDVIVSIAGKQVKSEIDLRTIVAQTPPSSVVEIKYVRDGSPKVVSATLEKAEDEPQAGKSKAIDKPELGLEVEKLSDDVADRINVPHSTPGVVLRSISPNSAAADEEDLTEGSVILKINDVETPTVDAFKLAVSKLKTGDAVRVCYLKSERGEGPVRRFTVIALD